MRIRSRQAGAKLAFFSWPRPTSGTANQERLVLAHFHSCIMRRVLDSKLVNSDHSVAGLLIRVGWSEASEFGRAFANPEEKNAVETRARYGDSLPHICAICTLRSLLIRGCALKDTGRSLRTNLAGFSPVQDAIRCCDRG